MKIYDEKSISGRKININYEGKFTLKLLMKINVEKPNVNKKCLVQKYRFQTQKFKNTQCPKMVPKRLYGYYLTSYEQFYVFQKIELGFTSVILKNSYLYQLY